MRVLVTGFGPFLSTTENPSARLAETCGRPYQILPVSYSAAAAFLAELDPSSFDVLLMLGVAGKRSRITPELFGRNVRGTSPDVEGVAVAGPIDTSGPSLAPSTLWTPALIDALSEIDEVEVSEDAGDYLCNFVAYQAVRRFPDRSVGFLHIPPFEELPFDRQAAVLGSILAAIEA